jgi:hypothetical protein
VLVVDEMPVANADYRRWMHTAVTTAVRSLTVTKIMGYSHDK